MIIPQTFSNNIPSPSSPCFPPLHAFPALLFRASRSFFLRHGHTVAAVAWSLLYTIRHRPSVPPKNFDKVASVAFLSPSTVKSRAPVLRENGHNVAAVVQRSLEEA